jgi:hypothetical protein
MNAKTKARVEEHGRRLLAIFPGATEWDHRAGFDGITEGTPMKMLPVDVSTHGFTCTCIRCGRRIEGQSPRFADLDGVPFRAYYCPPCAETRMNAKTKVDYTPEEAVAICSYGMLKRRRREPNHQQVIKRAKDLVAADVPQPTTGRGLVDAALKAIANG